MGSCLKRSSTRPDPGPLPSLEKPYPPLPFSPPPSHRTSMSAFNATRSLLRAPVVARQSALAGPRLVRSRPHHLATPRIASSADRAHRADSCLSARWSPLPTGRPPDPVHRHPAQAAHGASILGRSCGWPASAARSPADPSLAASRPSQNEGHPLPDSTPQNGPGGAERILGGIGVAVLILGGWTWFRSAQLKRERTGQTVTGNDPTKVRGPPFLLRCGLPLLTWPLPSSTSRAPSRTSRRRSPAKAQLAPYTGSSIGSAARPSLSPCSPFPPDPLYSHARDPM